ncbi:ABC transporter permease [Spiroplasma diminutum]|uniref:Ribose/galactose ABC transporter permease n=1 Tax=Spiroplasma diminutum CUAS-1 TaxID=1276221 RepID=S5LVG3_9MOLU|nr:ABC transporter permease [Spiroplasma diminutum]AGR41794.1 ribose/galactose ABC transporter permease [Spiroplasma diminutum CUAS-1]
MVSSLMEYLSIYFAVFSLAALAGLIAERSGVVNVGIEGYMIIGALTTSLFGQSFSESMGNTSQIIALLLGAIAGGIVSFLHSFAAIKLKADQIIAGTSINLLAQGFGLYLATSGAKTQIESGYITITFDSYKFLSIYLIIAILVTLISGLYFSFTRTGMRHISAGENPNALEAAGVNVIRYRVVAVFISGVIASLAGGIYLLTAGNANFYGTANGMGFLALAIMILGQWRVKFVLLGAASFALFFSISKAVPINLSGGWLQKNSKLFQVLPFVISLITMVVLSKWSKPPAALGIPYDKAKR